MVRGVLWWKIERGWSVMGLSHHNSIWFLQVHPPSGWSILFGCYHHLQAPSHRVAKWYWFNNSKCNVTVEVLFYLLLPVVRHWNRCVHCWCVAPWTKVMSNSLTVIICKSWCGHTINALDLKWSCSQCSNLFLLLSIGENRMLVRSSGAIVLQGQPHDAFSLVMADRLILDVWFGKFWCIRPKSFRADSER